jgi:hypothetical protein
MDVCRRRRRRTYVVQLRAMPNLFKMITLNVCNLWLCHIRRCSISRTGLKLAGFNKRPILTSEYSRMMTRGIFFSLFSRLKSLVYPNRIEERLNLALFLSAAASSISFSCCPKRNLHHHQNRFDLFSRRRRHATADEKEAL